MLNLGMVKPGSTIYVPFHTFDSNDPSASVTITGLATTDILIYKDGGTTERASQAGYTLLDTDGIDFDTKTGLHGFSIDLSDNTTANFYEAGSDYMIGISSITVDAATVSFWAARFTIGYADAILNTTIATLASQISFTLEEGPAEANALIGCPVLVHDLASSVQIATSVCSAYDVTTKTVTLPADPGIFSMAAGDNVSFFMPSNVQYWRQGAITAPETAGIPDTNPIKLDGDTDAMDNLRIIADNVNQATAQSGGASTIQLVAGESATDDIYNGSLITILSNTGAGQTRLISDYDGGTVTATVDPAWTTQPDNTSVYTISAWGSVNTSTQADTDIGTAVWTDAIDGISTANQAGNYLRILAQGIQDRASGATTLETLLGVPDIADWSVHSMKTGTADSGDTTTFVDAALTEANDYWNGAFVVFTSGTISGQVRVITDFDAVSDTVTFAPATTASVGTNTYEFLRFGGVDVAAISQDSTAANNLETACDNYSAERGLSGTALPAAAADAAGGLPISDAGGLDLDAMNTNINDIETDTNELQVDWTDGGRLDLLIDQILADTGTDGVVLSTATQQSIADTLLDRSNGIETSYTLRQALRLILSASAAKLSGAATTTVTIRDVGDSKNRITATVDADGNRSAVTLDAT